MERSPFGNLAKGARKLSAPYVLLVAVLAGVAGYVYGVLSAPTIKAHQMPPSWFETYFTDVLALLGVALFALFIPLAKSGYKPFTIALTVAWIIAGIVASLVGLREGISHSVYPHLFGLAYGGAAAALVATLIMGVRGAAAVQRRKKAAALEKIHERG